MAVYEKQQQQTIDGSPEQNALKNRTYAKEQSVLAAGGGEVPMAATATATAAQ